MKKIFSPSGIWHSQGIGILRIIIGLFMIYHGSEIFERAKMLEYGKWLTDMHFPTPVLAGYIGKAAELVSGVFMLLGLFTKLAVIPMMLAMAGICFGMGHGKIFSDDQY